MSARKETGGCRGRADIDVQPERGTPAAGGAGPPAWGSPRVFCVAAQAIPLPASGHGLSSLPHDADVALRMVPRGGEPFAIRAPRGVVTADMVFGLRYLQSGGAKLALVRALDVNE